MNRPLELSDDRRAVAARRWAFLGLVLIILIGFAVAWFWQAQVFGPVEVSVVNGGGQPVTVQIVEISEVTRAVVAEWKGHRLESGQSVTDSRYTEHDGNLGLKIVREDGSSQLYTLRRYVFPGSPLDVRLRLSEQGLTQAQVRRRGSVGFEDLNWDLGDEPAERAHPR